MSEQLWLRNRNDKFTAPLTYVSHLPYDFFLEIPGKDQDVVWLGLANLVWAEYRNVSSGCEFALLVWVAIDGVVEDVGADTAVVQQSVTFAGCAVAYDLFALI